MLITLCSWLYIFSMICMAGLILVAVIERLFHYSVKRLHAVLMLGIVGVTVYAETFSIFFKVGKLAIFILMGLCLGGCICTRESIRQTVGGWMDSIKKQNRMILICLLGIGAGFVLLGSYLASLTPTGFDEYNYHIPSIRWIEEYGVVKGLGNLHSRFGYNSSFLCLQALFSFSWLLPMSMHSMNGFIWTWMIISGILGLWWFEKRQFGLSDVLSILYVLMLLRFGEMQRVAGPNTDFFPFCITAYIFIQWSKLVEQKNDDAVPYGLLSMLGLFGATTKLSAGILFLFAIKPILQCVRERRYAVIGKMAAIGIIIFTPFVIRNAIITGYLLYPVAAIDLLDVDWKLPKSAIVSENTIIKLYARSNGSDYKYEYWTRSFVEWFKIWIQSVGDGYNVLGIMDLVLAGFVCVKTVCDKIRHKNAANHISVVLMAAAGVVYLFATAPSVRFGRWWFFALPIILLYLLFRGKEHTEGQVSGWPIRRVAAVSGVLMLLSVSFFIAVFGKYPDGKEKAIKRLILPSDYTMTGADGQYRVINGIRFYYHAPNQAGRNFLNGYIGFPGTEVLAGLTRFEFRGDGLEDGFKPKEEYRSIACDSQGNLMTVSAMKAIGLDRYYDVDLMAAYKDIGYEQFLYSQKLDTLSNEYVLKSGNLEYAIETDYQESDQLHTLSGWATLVGGVQSDNSDSQMVVCLKSGNDYWMGYPVNQNDIAEKEHLDRVDIGFVISTPEKIAGEICLVDMENKIIWQSEKTDQADH